MFLKIGKNYENNVKLQKKNKILARNEILIRLNTKVEFLRKNFN